MRCSHSLLGLAIVLLASSVIGCGGQVPAPQPVPSSSSLLTVAEQNEMLQAHNTWRAKYYSGYELIWSETLAKKAQQWANNLANQGYTLVHSGPGENLGSGYSTPTALVDGWCSESALYHGEVIDNSNYKTFGHFTQVVWKDTTEVGCGVARGNAGQIVWVCNYSPAGNVIGQKPF